MNAERHKLRQVQHCKLKLDLPLLTSMYHDFGRGFGVTLLIAAPCCSRSTSRIWHIHVTMTWKPPEDPYPPLLPIQFMLSSTAIHHFWASLQLVMNSTARLISLQLQFFCLH